MPSGPEFKGTTPGPRDYLVAQGYYLDGKPAYKAAMDAGYSESYSKCFGGRMVRSQRVQEALLAIERDIKPGDLGRMAKARLQRKLIRPPKDEKTELAVIRTAAEIDGLIGGHSELHLHQHNTLPVAVQKMLEDKMKEILGVSNGTVIDGLPEGAEGTGEGREDDEGV